MTYSARAHKDAGLNKRVRFNMNLHTNMNAWWLLPDILEKHYQIVHSRKLVSDVLLQ